MRSHRALSRLPAIALVSALGGCGDRLEQRVRGFAEPTTALESGDEQLASLLEEVRDERGLSSQLDKPLGSPGQNAAAALADAYSDQLHLRLAPQLSPLLAFDGASEARQTFLTTHAQLASKTAAAIDLPRCRYDVGHRYGFFATMGYLDDASLASRLMLLRALDRSTSSTPEALADLLRSLRVAHTLSRVDRVEPRILSATLREEALTVAGDFFAAGRFARFDAEQLYGRLRDQLADWPPDRQMLVGERATVVHAYEAIRGGMLERLLTLDEKKRLDQSGQLERVRAASAESIHADQARYLRAIKQLLPAAEQAHADRVPAIEKAYAAVNVAPGLFAGPLFLHDLPEALRVASADRARVEAWTIALAAVAELRPPPFRDSPLSGLPYEAKRDLDRTIVMFGTGPSELVALPALPR